MGTVVVILLLDEKENLYVYCAIKVKFTRSDIIRLNVHIRYVDMEYLHMVKSIFIQHSEYR